MDGQLLGESGMAGGAAPDPAALLRAFIAGVAHGAGQPTAQALAGRQPEGGFGDTDRVMLDQARRPAQGTGIAPLGVLPAAGQPAPFRPSMAAATAPGLAAPSPLMAAMSGAAGYGMPTRAAAGMPTQSAGTSSPLWDRLAQIHMITQLLGGGR